jgi:uncharacterized protein (TIGR03435 family)
VASVKPTAKDEAAGRLQMMARQAMRNTQQAGVISMEGPGRIRLQNWALLDLIAAAYRVRANQVSGPSWLGDQGFDLEAKAPEGTEKEQLNGMLQSLLEERFGLKAHHDSQTKSGFALVVGKNGPKLKHAEVAPTPEQREQRSAANRERMEEMRQQGTPLTGLERLTLPSTTTEQLAIHLARFTEAPVVDETGLKGKYSVTIETWKNPDVPGGTILEAVEKLGLKLEARKITVDTIVVDHVSKMPTAN